MNMFRPTATLVATAITLTLAACHANKPAVPLVAPPGKWESLFDGKDLEGWTVKIAGHDAGDNAANTFRVDNGVLKVSYDGYDKFAGQFGTLLSNRRLSHYWFRAEYRFVGDLTSGAPSWAYKNSGVQFHSQAPGTMRKEQEFPVSVEFDLVGGRLIGHYPTGDVCKNGSRLTVGGKALEGKCSKVSDISIPGDAWVTVLAEVDGAKQVRQAVNGFLVVEYANLELDDQDVDGRRLLGGGADKSLSAGFISLQSNGHPIEFRRIEVLPLD